MIFAFFWGRGETSLLLEGVNDLNVADQLPVIEIFGVECMAGEGVGSGYDGGVPVPKLVPAPDGDAVLNQFESHGNYGDVGGKC